MDTDDRLYRHSGRFSVPGLLIALPIIAATIFVISVIYGHAMAFLGWVWLDTLLVFFYGIGMGALVGFALHFGKCRNMWLTGFVGLVGALFGMYLSWGIWVYDVFEESLGANAHTYSVARIWNMAQDFAANGSYVLLTGTEIKGFMIWITWGLEFITVVVMAFWIAALVGSMGHFCERCRRWSDGTLEVTGLENRPISEISPQQLKAGDFSGLQGLGWAKAGDKAQLKINVDHCKGCNEFHVFSLLRVEQAKDDKGQLKTVEKPLVEDVLITPDAFDLIRELKKSRPKEVRRAEAREAGR